MQMSVLPMHPATCSEIISQPMAVLKDEPAHKPQPPTCVTASISAEEAAKLWDESLCTELPSLSSGTTEVLICDLRILSPELMEPLVYPISSITPEHTKQPLYTIKQGCLFSMGFSWRVANAPVIGFKCLIRIYRLGIPVYKGKVFLGTLLPREEPYTYFISEECAPKGVLAKGFFRAKIEFVDERNTKFNSLEYIFTFSENWA